MYQINDILENLKQHKSVFFKNSPKEDLSSFLNSLPITFEDVLDAENRLLRFKKYLSTTFPDTKNGIIESDLVELKYFKKELEDYFDIKIQGRVFAKLDNSLPIAGSIKARGGIYQVLKFAEDVLISNGILSSKEDLAEILKRDDVKKLFSKYSVVVGSTGNLGLSVGIMAAKLGFNAEVHMSMDAKQWKKKLLRDVGAKVVEHKGDYTYAVAQGRKRCLNDPFAHFVDDENSKELFLGYSVAAIRLKRQLDKLKITPSQDRPLCVYIPCGVGGAAGGISFGIAHLFKKNVKCYVAQPVGAPCVLAALVTGMDHVNIEELGINFSTKADGLAVASPSRLTVPILRGILDGGFTLSDDEMFWATKKIFSTEKIKIEPSAAAGFKGVYFTEKYLPGEKDHLIWLTGGILLPEEEFAKIFSS